MKKRDRTDPKPPNAALDAFKSESPKGYMRDRFFALAVDIVVIVLLCWALFLLRGVPDWEGYFKMQDAVRGLPKTDPMTVECERFYQSCFIISLTVGAAYEALMLVLFRATAGKLIFGLRVVDSKADRKFAVSRLILVARALIKMLSTYLLAALPFVFMCLTAFGNPERRSGFDMFSGTRVIRRNEL